MRYRPENRIECKKLSQILSDIDEEIDCAFFEVKDKDLEKIMKSTGEYYGKIGPEYDEIWYSNRARKQYRTVYSFLQREIAQRLAKEELVLDAGCGTCEWGVFMVGNGATVVGLNQSSMMLKAGKEKSRSQRLMRSLSLVRGDVSLLPFGEGTFDGATVQFVLSHLPDDELRLLLSGLERVVKKKGWMVFADTRLHEPHRQQEHVVRTLKSGKEYVIYKRYFAAEGLKTLLEQRLSRPFFASELDRWVICSTMLSA